jgi:hypothetical protein
MSYLWNDAICESRGSKENPHCACDVKNTRAIGLLNRVVPTYNLHSFTAITLNAVFPSSHNYDEQCELKGGINIYWSNLYNQNHTEILYEVFACNLLGCTLMASILIDHSGLALVPYKTGHSCTTRRPCFTCNK